MRHLSLFEESGIGPLHRIVFDTFREKYVVDHYETFPVINMCGEWDIEVGLVHDSREVIFFVGSYDGFNIYIADCADGEFQEHLESLRGEIEGEYGEYLPEEIYKEVMDKLNCFVEFKGAIVNMLNAR
jgi:hypothetical protein